MKRITSLGRKHIMSHFTHSIINVITNNSTFNKLLNRPHPEARDSGKMS